MTIFQEKTPKCSKDMVRILCSMTRNVLSFGWFEWLEEKMARDISGAVIRGYI